MGIPLMIQKIDHQRIEDLKINLGIHKKIEVIRAGLELLEKQAEQLKKIKRWKQAARLVAKNSYEVNKAFQAHSRIKSE